MYQETVLLLLDIYVLYDITKIENIPLFILTGNGKPQEIEYINNRTIKGVEFYTFKVAYAFNKTTKFELTQSEVFRAIYTRKTIYEFN